MIISGQDIFTGLKTELILSGIDIFDCHPQGVSLDLSTKFRREKFGIFVLMNLIVCVGGDGSFVFEYLMSKMNKIDNSNNSMKIDNK